MIRIAQFELRSVQTREVTAIFELRSVHTRDRICGLAFQSGRRWVARIWVPCQSNMHGARVSCASVHMQHMVYRQKWLEGHVHVAPPPNHNFEVKAFLRRFCCVIWEICHWKTPPDRQLCNSYYTSWCNFAYTRSKIPSFEWHSNCAIRMIIQIAHFALMWKQSMNLLTICYTCPYDVSHLNSYSACNNLKFVVLWVSIDLCMHTQPVLI